VEPLILDHSDTARRFGPPDIDREWSLDGKPRKEKTDKKDEDNDYPVCEKCGEMLAHGQRICPGCGFEKPKAEVVEVEGVMEDLQWKRPAPKAPPPQSAEQVALDRAKSEVNRAIGILVTRVAKDYETTDGGPIGRDTATAELNRLIYRRIGHSRTTASHGELVAQMEWISSSDGVNGSYSALEELVWVLRARKKGAPPVGPTMSEEEKDRVKQLALFAGAPLLAPARAARRRIPPKAPPAPPPAPEPPAPKIAPRAQREMDRALDRAVAANRAKQPRDPFGW
jgi:ribosomal protein L32